MKRGALRHGSTSLFAYAPALGLALTMALATPAAIQAQEAPEGFAATLDALQRAAGGEVNVTRSSSTGLATFMSAPGGQGIPVPGGSAGTPEDRALFFLGSYGRLFGLRDASQLRWVRTSAKDLVGMDHVRFQQIHNGVPVTGGELAVHLKGSRVVAVNGRTLRLPEAFGTEAAVEPARAQAAARDALAKHLDVTDAELSEPRLELFDLGLIGGPRRPTRLAWFIEARRTDVREFIWVDARTGGVLKHFSQITRARNRRIYTANNGASLPGTLIRSEGGPPTGDADADAAYDFSGDTYDYFFNEHGRDSYDGAGAILKSTVHFCPNSSSCPYQNAFWNGVQMVYGEGFSAADDVDAHELTHAVTERTAGLFYYMQSGALNESFSDIFGETVDLTNSAGDDTPGVRWLLGEDVPVFGAIRNMMDPTQFGDPGKMSDPQFDCFDSGQDAGGVHGNSGVPNHAYALMVDGGTYNGVTVTGIGLTKAGKIQYRALTSYLNTASDFQDDYNALNQSCTDLVGTAGISAADCVEVGKALDAVEMTAVWGGPTTPCSPAQPPEPDFCPVGQGPVDLFFDNLENRASGNWTTSTFNSPNHWTGGSGSPAIYFSGFATSGDFAFWGYDYNVVADSSANMARSVVLPPGARMQFNHSFGFENSGSTHYDGGVLEYSTNNGTTWLDAGGLVSSGAAYNGALNACCANPLAGRNAFGGESWGYTATQLDLSPLAGQSVRFRFRIGTDSSVSDIGWFIDDVRIYTCDVGGSVQLGAPSFTVGEAGPTATVTATRTGGSAGGVTADFATSDASATAGQDYTDTSGTLTFGSNVMSRTFTVPITNDTLDDDGESFDVSLSNVTGPTASLGGPSTAAVNITDNDVAGTLKFSTTAYTVAETGPLATITVSRSGGAASAVTVVFATSDGTAQAGLDYTATSGTLTFGAGQLSRTFTVPITNDTLDEASETISLALSSPGGGGVLGAPNVATLTVTDNDVAGAIHFGTSAYSKSEGGGSVAITVARSGAASNVTVAFSTSDGTATTGADYAATSGTLTFNAGQLSQMINVPILEDSLGENNETFKMMLGSPTGGATLSAPSSTTVTILENEAVLQFGAANYALVEGTALVTVVVKRSGLLTIPVSVDYASSPGTAIDGSDFNASGGTLSFASGATAKSFTVAILNDSTREDPETVLLSLLNPVGGALGPQSTSVLTITDNDSLLQFGAASYTVAESTALATITVKRTGSSAGAVGVNFATSDGSATTLDGDYGATSGTLTFAPGVLAKTFTVPISNDTSAEPTETIGLSLSSPTGGAGLGLSNGVLNITDNEPRLRFTMAAYSVAESTAAATITVTRNSSAGLVTVDFATSDGSASDGSDYTGTSGTLTFPAGILSKTFTVPITNDSSGEGNETVNLALSNPGAGAGLGTPNMAVLNILDNEPLLKFSAASYNVSESGVNATITVTRAGPSAPVVTVDFATSDGSATTAGSDYTTTSGTLVFASGVLSRTFTVGVLNDSSAEGNETVNLALSNPTGGAGLGTPKTAILNILDNEPLLQFGSATYTATEIGLKATITVKRVGSTAGAVGVTFSTGGGTATAGSDYTATSGALSFAPGVTAKTFVVPIANDTVDDNAETIDLALSLPTGGAGLGAPSTSVITITDNDVAGTIQFSATSYSVIENGVKATITLSRSGGGASEASVDLATSDGSADSSDYSSNSGTVTFTAGETSKTFTVDITDDVSFEGNETVILTLDNANGGAVLGARDSATLYIVENDAP